MCSFEILSYPLKAERMLSVWEFVLGNILQVCYIIDLRNDVLMNRNTIIFKRTVYPNLEFICVRRYVEI